MTEISAPIIVLGMHRSGTSLLMGCLQAAGLFLGDVNNLAPFNRKGNKENESIRAVHMASMERQGLEWSAPPSSPLRFDEREREELLMVLEPYRGLGRPWGFKDPRTVWFFEEWLHLFPAATPIAVFRHPILVAQSLAARTGDLSLSIEDGLHLWKETNLRILDLQERLDFPLLHFASGDELQTEFFDPLRRFAGSNGLIGDPSDFFDSVLVSQLAPHTPMPSDVQTVFEALIQAST